MQQHERKDVVVDLLAELERLSAMAKQTLDNMAGGVAVNGASGLQKIRDQAADAARRAREDMEVTAA